jgi:uncharacterized protein
MRLSISILLMTAVVTAFKRLDFVFKSQGETVASHLYIPNEISGRIPATVTAPGFGGLKEMLIPEFASRIADAGIATLAFDPIGFGNSSGKNRLEIDNEQQIATFKDAFNVLSEDQRFNSSRIGAWGTSLSGGHTINIAGTDKRVKAAVAIIPHIQIGGGAVDERIPLIGAIAQDMEAKMSGGKRVLVAAAGLPGSTAVMTEPGSVDFMSSMAKDVPWFTNQVTANSLLSMMTYNNTNVAKKITCPTLVISATTDTITPGQTIHQALDGVENVTIKDYPSNHFGLLGKYKSEVIQLTMDFLKKNL